MDSKLLIVEIASGAGVLKNQNRKKVEDKLGTDEVVLRRTYGQETCVDVDSGLLLLWITV